MQTSLKVHAWLCQNHYDNNNLCSKQFKIWKKLQTIRKTPKSYVGYLSVDVGCTLQGGSSESEFEDASQDGSSPLARANARAIAASIGVLRR